MGQIHRLATTFTGSNTHLLPLLPDPMPVTGATRVWNASALTLTLGSPVTGWEDTASGTTLASNTGTPTLENVDGIRTVRFTNDILQQNLALGQPHTVALAFKQVTLNTTTTASIFGAYATSGSDGGFFQTTPAGDFYANAGTALLVGSKESTVGWKRLIVTFNGASSVVRLNGTEYTGNTGTLSRTIFSLGGQRTGQFTDIAVSHTSIFPKALSAQERADLDGWLTSRVA